MNTPQAANPMSRYLGVAGVGIPWHLIGGRATVGGSSTPQAGEAARQGPPFVLASEVRSPAMNFSTGMAAPGSKDASGSASGGGGGQAASGGVKTPVKKAGVAVGQKKRGRPRGAASQPANKKQKTKGPDADQSIDALNDVTAVSGVNLREEQKQGPPFVLASEVRSPAMNFSTGMAAPGSKDASGSASGGGGGQAASGGVKTPVKKAGVAVGQKKRGRPRGAASQPANKKQKTKGPDADQSIDALNDVTAVSGVNLREEQKQGPPFVLASEVRSPAMNFSTGMAAPGSKDASGSASGGGGGQAASGGVKTPVKKAGVAVGQKKRGRPRGAASQPANKKQKTKGPDADQSIDALNDVTAVSGVNLREEQKQLLVGLEKESRTTEAMRKFVQKEGDRLFLQKGPLRTKVQAIAAKCGLTVSDDMERCLSLACNERLRSMLYKLITYSKQRCDAEKDQHSTVVSFDPRRQVLLMKRRAMETKQAAENERLWKLNGAQREEDDKMRVRAANVAARAAVGATDMLSKWQMIAAQGLAKRQGGDTGRGPGTGRGSTVRRIGAGQGGRQPRSMTMKDVIPFLEKEPMLSKSSFLYRLYERRDRKNESSRRL